MSKSPVARVAQISNYPPPLCGWAIHVVNIQRALRDHGADSSVIDIGPSRRTEGRDCTTVKNGIDYFFKLLRYARRGYLFEPHVNGDSWKGFVLASLAVVLGRLSGKPAVLMFHAGPSQILFPRQRGLWRMLFRLLFRASGEIICNFEPVRQAIIDYGVDPRKIHPIFSIDYVNEPIPVALSASVQEFLDQHTPRLLSYTLFRPEYTNEAMFAAFQQIRKRYPHAGLLIAGPPVVPDEIASQLRRFEIQCATLIPGNLPRPEFLTIMQQCDLFVRTPACDGLCATVIEALRLGVPVVAAANGLRPQSVISFEPGNRLDLESKILEVLADLNAARAKVICPDTGHGLESEIDLLLDSA